MEVHQIEKLDHLLKGFLGPTQIVIHHHVTRLTAAGENYGSLMLSVEVHHKSKNGEKTLATVVKVPPLSEFMQKMFNTPVTFRNEVTFYKTIVPLLQKFSLDRGVTEPLECFPKFLGGRFNLKPGSDVVDNDAVLILENLKLIGYETGERHEGLDLETSELILKTLAKFHAIPLAMKRLAPEAFQTKIKSLMQEYRTFEFSEELENIAFTKIINIVSDNEKDQVLKRKVEEMIKVSRVPFLKSSINCPDYVREPFATIIHNDAWVNNFMVKKVDGKPVDIKIVDFQLYQYGSPARDVIFFLYSSTQIPVLEEHSEKLIQTYFQELIKNLQKLGCDPSVFTFELFLTEIKQALRQFEVLHCLFMFEPIFASKDSVEELITEEHFFRTLPIPKKRIEKSKFLIQDLMKKNLI